MKYYAVAQGRTTGIFTSWPRAQAQVKGFPNAVYKSFKTRKEAEQFLENPVYAKKPARNKTASAPALSQPEAYPADHIVVYTDGSAIGNPGPGGYGAVIRESPDADPVELSGGFSRTTNNRMEALAVILALEELLGTPNPIVLHSDSKYVMDALNKGWAKNWEKRNWIKSDGKPALNKDLWQRMLPLVRELNVRFVWVKGHAGNPMNERCDVLANTAARQEGWPKDEGYTP